jgi:N-acetylglucosamine-6-sulfatase
MTRLLLRATLIAALVVAGTTLAPPAISPATPVKTRAERPEPGERVDARPNIVLITVDDMASTDLRWMPRTRRLLGRQGVRYTNFISPHPLCCPARAELFTGQYAQNNGVHHNSGRWGGWRAFDERHNIGQWLQEAGYRTAMVGKFLNGYDGVNRHRRVPGWDMWDPIIGGAYSAYGITMGNNYSPRRFEGIHNTDLVHQRTVANIRRFADESEPFFVFSSQVAPHGMWRAGGWVPPVSPVRHRGMFKHVRPPAFRDPAFLERNVADKPKAYFRNQPKPARAEMRRWFRARIQSLQSVDESVAKIVRELRRLGELRETVILFVSDNGYLLGEHSYRGKDVPWEEALRVPMLARGPGIPNGAVRRQTMTLVDVAPTLLDLADAEPSVTQDGRSLLPTLKRPQARGYSTGLIQGGSWDRPWMYRGVRTRRYTYTRLFSGRIELYDRRTDPHQLRSVARDPRYRAVRRELQRRTAALVDCAGADCQQSFGAEPVPRR